MGLTAEKEMQHACGQWLEARESFYGGKDELGAYREADRRLLAAFASDWTADDPKLLSGAYRSFRKALIDNRKRRFSTLVRSEKTPRSKFWA